LVFGFWVLANPQNPNPQSPIPNLFSILLKYR
jgi:hypothetical protein